ncbi:MAG: hypothetical protein M3Y84_12595 [Acidobacteriota bacterium]|nr:hypothetical protein [Acidobacteriota bacterium]
MNNINFGRVLLGGLLAGLVLNIGEFLLNEVVLKNEMETFFSRHNFHNPGGSFIAIAVALTFVLGIVIVLIYALIRPRLGPGPKAAIIAGLIAWFATYVYTGIINGVLLAVPSNALLIGLVWGLVEYPVGAIAGAWLYKEM